MKRQLIVALTFIAGLYYLLEYLVPEHIVIHPAGRRLVIDTYLYRAVEPLGIMFLVVGAFNIGLGLGHLLRVHGRVLWRREKGSVNSAGFYLAFFGMLVVGLWWKQYESMGAKPPRWLALAFDLMFNRVFISLVSSVFALLAFYIVSAAYRAFRVRSFEATLMMLSAIILMLGQVPLGRWLTESLPTALQLPTMANWIMNVVNSAAVRGIIFGATVGAIAMALRIWLSLERGAFFEKQV